MFAALILLTANLLGGHGHSLFASRTKRFCRLLGSSASSSSSSSSRRRCSVCSRRCHKRFESSETAAAAAAGVTGSSTTCEKQMLPAEIVDLLHERQRGRRGLEALLQQLLAACQVIGVALREGEFTSSKVGTVNSFGDGQLDVDVRADQELFDSCKRSGVVHVASSEEMPHEVDCGYRHDDLSPSSGDPIAAPLISPDQAKVGHNAISHHNEGFSVAFDPLDGSSVVDANFAVGTILGIWPGKGFLGRSGRDQVASFVCVYGPKVTMALALNGAATKKGEAMSVELTMEKGHWEVTNKRFAIATRTKYFAPGNLRATGDNPDYRRLISFWMESLYTLRYSGGMVPDVYHILVKGQGVFSNASSRSAKAKLRLLYEAAPIALLVEAAGGDSCAYPTEAGEAQDPISLLDVQITDLDQRLGLCLGSTDEVARFKEYLFVDSPYRRHQYTIEDNTNYHDS